MNHHPRGEIVWVCNNSSCFYAVYHGSPSYLDQPPEKKNHEKGRTRGKWMEHLRKKMPRGLWVQPVEDWSPHRFTGWECPRNYVQRAKAMEASMPCWRVQTSQRFMLYSTPTQSCRATVVEDPLVNQQALRVRGGKIYWLVPQKINIRFGNWCRFNLGTPCVRYFCENIGIAVISWLRDSSIWILQSYPLTASCSSCSTHCFLQSSKESPETTSASVGNNMPSWGWCSFSRIGRPTKVAKVDKKNNFLYHTICNEWKWQRVVNCRQVLYICISSSDDNFWVCFFGLFGEFNYSKFKSQTLFLDFSRNKPVSVKSQD